MSASIRLGIIFSHQEGWVGGTYYLLNLISALKRIESRRRPSITVYYSSEAELEMVRNIGYPEARYRALPNWRQRGLIQFANRVALKLIGRPVRLPSALPGDIDVIYPGGLNPIFRRIPNRLFWIPDFQEEYLPEMFGRERVENRRNYRRRIAQAARHVVFSSKHAARDFRRFYPSSNAATHVLNFAVTHPELGDLSTERLREKYGIGGDPYFLVSNQFWKHKNHRVAVEALRRVAESGNRRRFLVCFSGKEHDPRNPEYFGEIRDLVRDYGLDGCTRFLGFIDREDQLRLMKESLAVIQPSLFEGWSTVIEDAKALSVPVIASDLPVHLEQLGDRGLFFGRENSEHLSSRMQEVLKSKPDALPRFTGYDRCVEKFGETFLRILADVVRTDTGNTSCRSAS